MAEAFRNGAASSPSPASCWSRHFPRGNRHYLVCYPFEGRLAHQTLGMLLTRRLERLRLGRWVLSPMNMPWRCGRRAIWAGVDLDALFDEDMLGDDLDAWLAESNLYKRTFRNVAIIAGLIERKLPGKEKTGRQVTFSSDLIYDVLRAHEPDHVLLRATYADAGTGLLDIARLWRYAGADKKTNCHAAAGPGFAFGGAGAAGDFPRNGGAGRSG